MVSSKAKGSPALTQNPPILDAQTTYPPPNNPTPILSLSAWYWSVSPNKGNWGPTTEGDSGTGAFI